MWWSTSIDGCCSAKIRLSKIDHTSNKASPGSAMGNLLIEDGSVLDATGAKPKQGYSLYIQDNVIRKVGPAKDLKAFAAQSGPYDSRDATGRTVMPGLIDCHVHPTFGD